MHETDSTVPPGGTAVAVPSANRDLQTETLIVLNVSPKKVRRWILALLLALVTPPAIYYYRHFHHIREGLVAYDLVSRGYGALALEWIDSSREDFVSNAEDCAMVLKVYELAFRLDRLHWAAEACKAAKVEISEVHQALGHVFSANGKWDQARAEFELGAFKFLNAEGFVKLSEFLFAHFSGEEATAVLITARGNMPDSEPIDYQLLKIYSRLKQYDKAAALGLSAKSLYRSKKFLDATLLIETALLKTGQKEALHQLATGKVSIDPVKTTAGPLARRNLFQDQRQPQTPTSRSDLGILKR
ncbi:MAG: hypothetical protein HY074_09245 [Deltaproteobacteria bacterium]|nr:hypothetical protein [Deltaproteobacteria bacterium]